MAGLRQVLRVVAIAVLSALAASSSQDAKPQKPISPGNFSCEHPPYRVKKVSSSPLMMYIQDFLTAGEREHLQAVTRTSFRHSAIAGAAGASKASIRTSQSSYVARDAVVRCVEDRALAFQGYDVPRSHLEPLQLVRYEPGERYGFHTDWFTDPRWAFSFNGGNRQTSFFVYVAVSDDATGGGTNFPLVDPPRDARWCAAGLVDCDAPYEDGLTFRPVEGNAIFWENMTPAGVGDGRTLHAGLPVTTGEKIGMNIWTRQAPLSEEARGSDEYPDVDI